MQRNSALVEPPLGNPTMSEAQMPLCVDLDGTLTTSDTLVEGLIGTLGGPAMFGAARAAVTGGRASLKRYVATARPTDASQLPYCAPLLDYIRAARTSGRRIVLVTAADMSTAQAVADHLGVFDEVIASDGRANLKGAAKAEALVQRFGHQGFTYVGNDVSDLEVWRHAGSAILVNASPQVAKAARALCEVEAEFPPAGGVLRGVVRALRPQQWSKNLLIFIPLFTAHVLDSPGAWLAALATFLAFCATASAIYLVNDLTDLSADRRHPRKRLRPFASGAVPIPVGLWVAATLLVAGFLFGLLGGSLPVLLLYALLSVTYSLRLKELPLVDVFVLAGLYTLRIYAGAVAIGHSLSLWLLGFSAFFFLSLALVKRVEELRGAAERGGGWLSRRGYMAADTAILQTFGVASCFAASLVLALFVQSEATGLRYASPGLLWGIVPLILFWQCRIWLSTARGYMHDDPIVYASRDWVSWIVAGSALLILLVAKSIGGVPALGQV